MTSVGPPTFAFIRVESGATASPPAPTKGARRGAISLTHGRSRVATKWRTDMKTLIFLAALFASSTLLVPTVSFAQTLCAATL